MRKCGGLPLDSRGHHRAAARRGVGQERVGSGDAAARICREARVRKTTNVLVKDLNLAAPHIDMEARSVADGLRSCTSQQGENLS